jgi:hypothetical protein
MAVVDLNPTMAFCETPMNYRAFTNDSLTMMYKSIRGAWLGRRAEACRSEARFAVRKTPDWLEHAGNLEVEMLRRGITFEIIDWSEDQGSLPL